MRYTVCSTRCTANSSTWPTASRIASDRRSRRRDDGGHPLQGRTASSSVVGDAAWIYRCGRADVARYAYFTVGLPAMATAALVLLMIAALGGVVLKSQLSLEPVASTQSIVLVHALIAVTGFTLLLGSIFLNQA